MYKKSYNTDLMLDYKKEFAKLKDHVQKDHLEKVKELTGLSASTIRVYVNGFPSVYNTAELILKHLKPIVDDFINHKKANLDSITN